jgi:hypothetical protein
MTLNCQVARNVKIIILEEAQAHRHSMDKVYQHSGNLDEEEDYHNNNHILLNCISYIEYHLVARISHLRSILF